MLLLASLPALAITVFVSPGDAFRDSLALLGSGDTLYMMPGTYSIPDTLPLLHVHSWQDGIVITGDSTDRPLLDGLDYARPVVYMEGPHTAATVIEYLSLTGGNTSEGEFFAGGGFLLSSSSCLIRYCSITECTALFGGGIYAEGGSPILEWLEITGNSALVSGGGLSLYASDAVVRHSVLSGNSSGDDGGGIYSSMGDVHYENLLITGNESLDDGGGMMQLQGLCDLYFVTIDSNTCGDDGGGILASFVDSLAMHSCIVTRNMGSGGVARKSGAEPYFISHCCVWDNEVSNYQHIPDPTGTEGNISEDPLYADPLHRLSQIAAGQAEQSPCVDTGHSSIGGSVVENLSTRTDSLPDTGVADMGFHHGPPDTSSGSGGGIPAGFVLSLFPSPCRGSVILSISVDIPTGIEISAYDISGRKISSVGDFFLLESINFEWEVPQGIPAGLIFVEVSAGTRTVSDRFVYLP